ncbi:hypothetical protein [Jatrophihabitans fulvus]
MRRPLTKPISALIAVLSLVAGTLLGLVSAAPASAAPGYPVDVCATIAVSTTVPQPGERITVSGVDFVANADVTLVLKPVSGTASDREYGVGTARTDGQGSFRTTIVMPAEAIGTYDLHATSGLPNDASCPADPTQRLRLGAGSDDGNNAGPNGGPAGGGDGGTANTGLNVLLLLLVAAALIALGAYVTRRNRARTTVRV